MPTQWLALCMFGRFLDMRRDRKAQKMRCDREEASQR